MAHTTTWRCCRCKNTYSTVAGSKFLIWRGEKRRLCPDCVKEVVK